MIFVGGGALDAAAEVRALAERLTAPVVSYRRGRVLDDRHQLSHSLPGGHAPGRRPTSCSPSARGCNCRSAPWGTDDNLKLIKIDIDREDDRIRAPEIGLVGDAAVVLGRMEQHSR